MTARDEVREARILIVDDEEYNVDYLQQVLSDLGFRTREAYGGRQALDIVIDEPPDLILLDVMMPDIDGITVCQMLKSDPGTQLIPIVIMTALDGQEDRIRGIEAGADDFLTKPVDERELIARINSLLRTKRAVDQAVDELESASAQLEELGTRHEEVAVLAVELRPGGLRNEGSPAEARDYIEDRYMRAISRLVESHNGQLVSSEAGRTVAIVRPSSGRAIDVATAIRDEIAELNHHNDIQHFEVASGIQRGRVLINPERVDDGGAGHWITHVTGEPVERALDIAARANPGEIVSDPEKSEDAASPARQLKTIFVSDIVGSTEVATQLGDKAWTGRLDDHFRLVRDNLSLHGGEEISTAGDGFLALFESPAKAIRAGFAICDESVEIGLPVRVGIHTGELERSEHEVTGIAVHLAARVSAQAEASEVLVTSTTKEAVAGSGLQFVSKGRRELKGIEGDRELFLALRA